MFTVHQQELFGGFAGNAIVRNAINKVQNNDNMPTTSNTMCFCKTNFCLGWFRKAYQFFDTFQTEVGSGRLSKTFFLH